jgi:hypothetical protein
MNDHDRKNLMFLLNSTPDMLADWYIQVTEDDHEYASELMSMYSKELEIKNRFYAVESVDLTNLTPDAELLLKRYRL